MVIVVTNRKLCPGDFLPRLHELAKARPGRILLREKDLSLSEYTALAKECQDICSAYDVPLTIHSHPQVAKELGVSSLHLPLPLWKEAGPLPSGLWVGTSVHSVKQALEAWQLGAQYLIAGHIFPTGCKPGLPPRGLSFLKKVCQGVPLPVYAIGGIGRDEANGVMAQGAVGFCVMSELMQCPDPYERLRAYVALEKELRKS